MKKRLAIGIIALLVLGVGAGAAMIAAYTKYTDMGANGTEFPEDEMRALLRKYNVTEDNITVNGLEYTMDELLDLYRKYNITGNDLRFAMDNLPHFLEGTILDGKHKVIATNTGKPPEYLKEGENYTLISAEEMIAIEEDARERYIAKYGVDPGNTKITVANGIPFPKEEMRRLIESGEMKLVVPSLKLGPLRFRIYNQDVSKHEVTVEIFDSDGKSIFNKTYESNPKERISSPKIAEKEGNYVFKVTMDNEIEKITNASVGCGLSSGVDIWVYEKDSEKPIYIIQKMVSYDRFSPPVDRAKT